MSQKGSVVIFIFVTAHVALILGAICLSTHYWIEAHPNPTNTTTNSSTPHRNTTVLTYSKGLWKYCYENETTVYYPKYQHGKNGTNETVVYHPESFESENCSDSWQKLTNMTMKSDNETTVLFLVTKYAYTDGVCTLAVGIVFLYVFLFVQRARNSVCLAVMMTLLFFASGGLFVVALVINGQHYQRDEAFQVLSDICGLFVVALVINGQHYQRDEDFKDLENYELSVGWSMYIGIACNVFTLICACLSAYNVKLVKFREMPYENLHQLHV